MKKRNLFTGFAVATMFIVIATGCKKDNNGSGSSGVSATVDGKAWQSKLATGIYNEFESTTVVTGLSVVGTDSSFMIVPIHDSAAAHVGESVGYSIIGYYSKNKEYTTLAGSGHSSLTVTSYDKNSK